MTDQLPIIQELIRLGFTPLNVVLIVGIVILYRDNRMLFQKLDQVETKFNECKKKLDMIGRH